MIVYRICYSKFAKDNSGEGARIYGGRWNSKGTPALYTSVYRSLSALEMASHLHVALLSQPLSLISFDTADFIFTDLRNLLPPGWNTFPAGMATQKLGDMHLQKSDCAGIIVPSVIIEEESNIILNPGFKHYKKIVSSSERRFTFDPRLTARQQI